MNSWNNHACAIYTCSEWHGAARTAAVASSLALLTHIFISSRHPLQSLMPSSVCIGVSRIRWQCGQTLDSFFALASTRVTSNPMFFGLALEYFKQLLNYLFVRLNVQERPPLAPWKTAALKRGSEGKMTASCKLLEVERSCGPTHAGSRLVKLPHFVFHCVRKGSSTDSALGVQLNKSRFLYVESWGFPRKSIYDTTYARGGIGRTHVRGSRARAQHQFDARRHGAGRARDRSMVQRPPVWRLKAPISWLQLKWKITVQVWMHKKWIMLHFIIRIGHVPIIL